MKGILTKLMSVVVCMAMMAPLAEAQHRPGSNGGRTSRPTQQTRPQGNHSRPANSGSRPGTGNSSRPNNNGQGTRPGNGNNHRPGTGNGNNRPNSGNHGTRPGSGNNHRPGNNGSGNNHRPGNNGSGNNHRPGNNDNHRPGNGNHRPGGNGGHRPDPGRPDGVRPGFNHNNRPGNSHGPAVGHRPGHSHRPPYVAPPSRPYRPSGFRGPFSRPLPPPPGWRPRPGIPVINGILGLTFGSGISISLDYLFNNGYTVDGYGNDMIYLRNVPALNYIWTDATLYYGNGGGFDGSSFYYSTPYYDLGRYNAVYNTLVGTYGMPVAVNNGAGTFLSTWYGGNNGFITLRFNAQATVGGSVRYFTTLSFGN